MIPLPTAQGELPDFHALDPLVFQALCRDLYQVEPNISTAEVFGTPGQGQRGIDVLASHRNDHGISVGQCKRIEVNALNVKLIQNASSEFLEHLDYWRDRNVKRFILFVAPDASRKEISEEHLRQRAEFLRLGIGYEIWGQALIVNKLRPHPGIARTYLRDPWTEVICGNSVGRFPQESLLVERVLHTQLEVLAGHVSTAAENEVEELRILWREGHRSIATEGIARLRDAGRWQAFPSRLQATIARFEAQLALESGDVARAQAIGDEAERLDPTANLRLRALIARRRFGFDDALAILGDPEDVDAITLKAGLLLEANRVTDSLSVLEHVTDIAESHRLKALAYVLQHDLPKARLEIIRAVELEPTWISIRYSEAIVYYLSGLSPAVLPDRLPPWPEPEHWEFIKTDDDSRNHFKRAAAAIAAIDLEDQAADDRAVLETWCLAAMASDPERRDEASEYCRNLLARNPRNYRAVVWAVARRLEVDLSQSTKVLLERVEAGDALVPEIVAVVLLQVHAADYARAAAVLTETRERFVAGNAEGLWKLWQVQVAAAAGSSQTEPQDASKGDAPETLLVSLRAGAKASGDSDALISELQDRHANSDGQASLELCRLLGSQERWDDSAVIARTLMTRVGTAEALRLASATLYNASDFSGALDLLESHREVLPHAELPSEMRRLRLLIQRRLGMLPDAAAEAEDLFRSEPSQEHFSLLADLYFQKGDFHALAQLARQHERFEAFTTGDLLRLTMRIAAEDRALARALWRRAAAIGFPDDEVAIAVDAGYRLGLDRDLRTLIQRMMQLAGANGSGVKNVGFDELKKIVAAHREDAERVYSMYRSGHIPIHLLSQQLKRPVAYWYHRTLEANRASGHSDGGPTFTRSGWRSELSINIEPNKAIRIHADTTALLTAQQFGVLGDFESTFAPIFLPHGTPIALAHMRDSTLPHQPSRRDALQVVFDLVTRQLIRVAEDADAKEDSSTTASHRLLDVAIANQWLLVDFFPLTGANAEPFQLPQAALAAVRSGHCVVQALRAEGEISDDDVARAREALGPERGTPTTRDLTRGASILCSSGILEQLAAGGILLAATRTFSIHILRHDFDVFIRRELDSFATANSDADWLTELIDRVNNGIDSGLYILLPAIEHEGEAGDRSEDDPTFGCLLDLLRVVPVDGGAIWVDDRWATGYAHKDGLPILDTFDLLHLLRTQGKISDGRFEAIQHAFRDADLRLFSLGVDEIKNRTRQAIDQGGQFRETRELRSLRRQYARCLIDSKDLTILPRENGRQLEWSYLLESGRAVVDSLVELWGEDEEDEQSRLRSEWILANLYVPDRGRAFTTADTAEGFDHQLEAISLTALLSHAITQATTDRGSQEKRRRYLAWIFDRLIRRRMDADGKLAISVVDSLKSVLVGSFGSSNLSPQHSRVAKALVRNLLADLPEDLTARISEDTAFLRALDISGGRIFKIGPHEVNAEEFWMVSADVVKKGSDATITTDGRELVIKLDDRATPSHLIVEDASRRMHYLLLTNELGVLAESVVSREASIRQLASSFDLPRADADTIVSGVASIENPGDRVMEIARLRRVSAEAHYLELDQKIRGHQGLNASDFLLENVEALMRHLRLGTDVCDFTSKLQQAASVLLEEIGLENTIIRLAGIPSQLPSGIRAAIAALEADERRKLLGSLTQSLGKSPIGSAHVARICADFGAERPGYRRYAKQWSRRSVLRSLDTRPRAWREVLRVCANELAHLEAFRHLPAEMRLALVWAHGDRIFRSLANGNASEEWIRDQFGGWSSRLPAEIAFADAAYLGESTHPKHLELVPFALASAAYVMEGIQPDGGLRADISAWLEGDATRLIRLLQLPGLRPDSLGSLAEAGSSSRIALLTSALRDRVSPTSLVSQVEAALTALAEGSVKEAWLVLVGVVNDQAVPAEMMDRLRAAVSSVDLAALHSGNAEMTPLVAAFVARQAPRLGPTAVEHVRAQLVAYAREVGRATTPDEHEIEALLSCPFYLYSDTDAERDSRFVKISSLLEEIVNRVPHSVKRAQHLLDRLVEGLPNHHARALWALQVKLRVLR